MKRESFVLVALFSGKGAVYSPVQLQKMLFLVDRNLKDELKGPVFNFQPYDYGPFDKSIYSVVESLAKEGLVVIQTEEGRGWNTYTLSDQGARIASQIYSALPEKARAYFEKISGFVRKLSFEELLSAIYKAYPEMAEKSLFRSPK